jgi:prephenate dehydrogenase
MVDKKITIIGLGLIGGSLARALRERLGITNIIAINRSSSAFLHAIKDGNVREGFCETNEAIWDSDIIFICTPVKRTIEYIEAIAPHIKPGCIITDVGSTKSEIIEYINHHKAFPCFVGGHPMAGSEKVGYSESSSHLFENAYYVLTPSNTSTQTALDTMHEIVKGLGAIPIILDAVTHDKITGSISHVPHIIASALVNLVHKADSTEGVMQMLAAGGFKDITRIASSSPEMWENIVLSNQQQINEILTAYVNILLEFKEQMNQKKSTKVLDFFKQAKTYRDSFTVNATNKTGLISSVYEIVVDVIDKPGIIGEIATLLGKNQINIKNISVTNSREYEQGCLKITLQDQSSVNVALRFLEQAGYRAFKST